MIPEEIDERIPILIEQGIKLGHRTLLVIVGDNAQKQVVVLHHILKKARQNDDGDSLPILWGQKRDFRFDNKLKRRFKQLQRKLQYGSVDLKNDDPFELFLLSANIRFCLYSQTEQILGNTFSMCVLQDFEALTPNILARTIETVQGGGLVVLLLKSMKSLKELYTLDMEVHQKLKTEAHHDVKCRFNERFVLSLSSCQRCLVLDETLAVLPICSRHLDGIEEANFDKKSRKRLAKKKRKLLADLKAQSANVKPCGDLIDCCKTYDQAKALVKFVESAADRTSKWMVSLTASRGRGKSAALGLAVSAAISLGYSRVFLTSPSPENLNTLFEFVSTGLNALGYEEHKDYEVQRSSANSDTRHVVKITVHKDNHQQTIQYIEPNQSSELHQPMLQPDLLVIDEAAAIPLPHVKSLLGPYLVFMASTINGYEGTGRSLSLKLLQQIRMQQCSTLHELTLEEPIRYNSDDPIELWLTKLLCLDSTTAAAPSAITHRYPDKETCNLYYINRDALFSYHKASERFLQHLVALYVASHYKNTPNDLQMMADAPAHHLFCLTGPMKSSAESCPERLPEVLCMVQVCLEGSLKRGTIVQGFRRGMRAPGDLIPWAIGKQFLDQEFPSLNGARIMRIATHPDCHGMGYGTRALSLLCQYYSGRIPVVNGVSSAPEQEEADDEKEVESGNSRLLHEQIAPKKSPPALLERLSERPPEHLDYLGVSYGLTEQLFKFWKRSDFVPVYVRQTTNDLTGEHSCIMLNDLSGRVRLDAYFQDFRRRFLSLLAYDFRKFSQSLALNVLTCKGGRIIERKSLSESNLEHYFTASDVKRLEHYSNNLIEYEMILDLIPNLARIYFFNLGGDIQLSALKSAILLALGLQHKSVECLSKELDAPSSQLLEIFGKINRTFLQYFKAILRNPAESSCDNKNGSANSKDLEKSRTKKRPLEMEQQNDEQNFPVKKKKKKNKKKNNEEKQE